MKTFAIWASPLLTLVLTLILASGLSLRANASLESIRDLEIDKLGDIPNASFVVKNPIEVSLGNQADEAKVCVGRGYWRGNQACYLQFKASAWGSNVRIDKGTKLVFSKIETGHYYYGKQVVDVYQPPYFDDFRQVKQPLYAHNTYLFTINNHPSVESMICYSERMNVRFDRNGTRLPQYNTEPFFTYRLVQVLDDLELQISN